MDQSEPPNANITRTDPLLDSVMSGVERGRSLAVLQQVLGDASSTTTQRYARLSDEAVMREASRLSQANGGLG